MNENFTQIKEYLEERFEKLATKEDLDGLAVKLVTLEEFDKFGKDIKQDVGLLRESVQALTASIDKLVKAVATLNGI